jgi:methionyl-tRNA formyltransferase
MRINEGLDTGNMLLKWETGIGAEETAIELSERLAPAGAELLVRTLAELTSIQPAPQDDSQASYAPILKKEDGKIEWTMPPREILNRIRGFVPWPGAYGFLRGQRLHVWKAAASDEMALRPGALRVVHRKLYAGCGEGSSIELREVQLEGKKRMQAEAFLNGFPMSGDEALQ